MKYPQSLTKSVMFLGNRYFSIYLVRGRSSHTLIESGISSTAGQIISQARSLDVDASKIRNLILTHTHADHITGAPVLKRLMPWIKVKTASEKNISFPKRRYMAFF
jgi:glyoxylase-like metal-dependent hydrolase (beta-lactamase superfamily II)